MKRWRFQWQKARVKRWWLKQQPFGKIVIEPSNMVKHDGISEKVWNKWKIFDKDGEKDGISDDWSSKIWQHRGPLLRWFSHHFCPFRIAHEKKGLTGQSYDRIAPSSATSHSKCFGSCFNRSNPLTSSCSCGRLWVIAGYFYGVIHSISMGLVQYKHNWYNSGHNCNPLTSSYKIPPPYVQSISTWWSWWPIPRILVVGYDPSYLNEN